MRCIRWASLFLLWMCCADGVRAAENKRIYEIQGSGHFSLILGVDVITPGIVTAKHPTGDANGDGTWSFTADEFVELVNTGNVPLDISGFTLSDGPLTRFTFPGATGSMTTVLPAGGAAVVFGGGVPPVIPGALSFSSTGLDLSDVGETISVRNGVTVVTAATYLNDTFSTESMVRSPELTGKFVLHGSITGLTRWSSPGLRTDGSAYPFAGVAGGGLVITEINYAPARSGGFWMQDATGDGNPLTSDAIFVPKFGFMPELSVGDSVEVTGHAAELLIEGSSTTIISMASITILSSGNAVPVAIIGQGGRRPPTSVIDNDSLSGQVIGSVNFDPQQDGIDFWETLESMVVRVENARVVAPTNPQGDAYVVADGGAGATGLTPRGGIVRSQNDVNPEWVQIDAAPQGLNVGAALGVVEGVLDFNGGYFSIRSRTDLAAQVIPSAIQRETTTIVGGAADKLRVGSFNVMYLDPSDGPVRFARMAGYVVNNLKAPDIVALQNFQDNNGDVNDGTVSASLTASLFTTAIVAAGGPSYTYIDIAPLNNMDGAVPDGNIRNAFLYRADRVSMVNRGGPGTATETAAVAYVDGKPVLNRNPVRIRPTSPSWSFDRKSLVAEFEFNGVSVYVINNHFSSTFGSTPLYGRQPPVNGLVDKRNNQALEVVEFVGRIVGINQNANIVVLGTFNELEFNPPLLTLTGSVPTLFNLNTLLPASDRYTDIVAGNSQQSCHQFVSERLRQRSAEYDIVHLNSEFTDREGDNDPDVSSFVITNNPPQVETVNLVVNRNSSVTRLLAAIDADEDKLSYTIVGGPAKGSASLSTAPSLLYTPFTNAWEPMFSRFASAMAARIFCRRSTSSSMPCLWRRRESCSRASAYLLRERWSRPMRTWKTL